MRHTPKIDPFQLSIHLARDEKETLCGRELEKSQVVEPRQAQYVSCKKCRKAAERELGLVC